MKRSSEPGIANLRELGGFRGRDDRRVKSERIYRSGTLDLPVEVLGGILDPLGISQVFDLRSGGEVEMTPYRLPDHIPYRHRPVLASMEGGENITLDFSDKEAMLSMLANDSTLLEKLLSSTDFMMSIYEEMGSQARIFGDIMKEMIAGEGAPVLYHCSAGKDRTGILSTMILLTLGVSREDVTGHYLLSNQYRKAEIDHEMKTISEFVNHPDQLELVRGMMLVKEEYLQTTLKAIDAYPAFDDYAVQELGLTRQELETFRDLYLE